MKCGNPECGRDFLPHDDRQRYCCKKCLRRAHCIRTWGGKPRDVLCSCLHCGSSFIKKSNSTQKYCDVKCKEREYYARDKNKPEFKAKEKARKAVAYEKNAPRIIARTTEYQRNNRDRYRKLARKADRRNRAQAKAAEILGITDPVSVRGLNLSQQERQSVRGRLTRKHAAIYRAVIEELQK